jgi:muramidase (phage lysozyme)
MPQLRKSTGLAPQQHDFDAELQDTVKVRKANLCFTLSISDIGRGGHDTALADVQQGLVALEGVDLNTLKRDKSLLNINQQLDHPLTDG